MTPHTQELLRDSWTRVQPLGSTAAELFYERLFSIDPSTRSLFARTDFTVQHEKLLQAIAYIVSRLEDAETLLPALAQLGARHRHYGVQAHHYDSVGTALLWTLEQGLGRAWTPAVRQAWTEAYDTIATVMRHAANEPTRTVSMRFSTVSAASADTRIR